MPLVGKNNLATVSHPGKITVLLVSQEPEDAVALQSALPGAKLHVHRCSSVGDLPAAMHSLQPSVVISEGELPDGTWRTVLTETDSAKQTVPLLVVSRMADEHLWAEVLNLGGFDVLLKPFDSAEVTRVLQMAIRYWENLNGQFTPQTV